MRVVRDFKCRECNTVKEVFIDNAVEVIGCDCGGRMEKQLSFANVVLDGTDPGLPGAYDKWARVREKRFRDKQAKM